MTKAITQKDEQYMLRALELAKLGSGSVSPNPLVGCVIVHQDTIIGEGWHQVYGQAHAEVNAINAVADKSLLKESTVYVTLEPCSHFGKTPPCAHLLIEKNVKRVVICNVDSNPLVSGKGIDKLHVAGIDVMKGVLEEQGRALNKRFFTLMEKKRPYIILKWAQTADGFIARENYDSKWISDEYSRQLVHKWRAEEDAILVGSSTALHDNPTLNVRGWTGRDPVRVVIDKSLKLPANLNLFKGPQRTICYNLKEEKTQDNVHYAKIGEEQFIQELIKDLCTRKIQSIIVEGGAKTLQAFIDANLWDEARVFCAPVSFEKGIAAPHIKGKKTAEIKLKADTLKIISA